MLVYHSSAAGCSTPLTLSSSQSTCSPIPEAGHAKENRKSPTSSRKHDAIRYASCFFLGIIIFYMMNSLIRIPDERLEWELQSCKNTVEILDGDNEFWTNSAGFWKDMYEKEVQRGDAQRADAELERILQEPAWECGTGSTSRASLSVWPRQLISRLLRLEGPR